MVPVSGVNCWRVGYEKVSDYSKGRPEIVEEVTVWQKMRRVCLVIQKGAVLRTAAWIIGAPSWPSLGTIWDSKTFHSSGDDFNVERNVMEGGSAGWEGRERGKKLIGISKLPVCPEPDPFGRGMWLTRSSYRPMILSWQWWLSDCIEYPSVHLDVNWQWGLGQSMIGEFKVMLTPEIAMEKLQM